MGAIPKISALFETTLSAKMTSSGSSATLDSVTDKAGVDLTGLYGFIIDEGSASEEFVIGTLAASVLTITFRGLNPNNPYTEVTALKFAHARGASVKITDYPVLGLLRNILNGDDGLPNILQYDTDKTFTDNKDLVAKKYVDDIAIAGGIDASISTKGISKLSKAPDSPTNPIAVGDNDTRMLTQAQKDAIITNDLVNVQTDNTIGNLVGGSSATSNYATWGVVTDGSFRISVDGTTYNIDAIDFSGDISMADVAATLQAALRAATGGTETLVWSTDHFVITSTTSNENSEISVTTTSTGTVGTDISGLGGTEFMDCDAGTATQGTSDHDKLVKLDTDGMIDESFIEKDTDGTLAADSDLVIPSQKAVKTYVDSTVYVPQQRIAIKDSNSLDTTKSYVTSEQDGSVLYVVSSNYSSTYYLYRLAKDSQGNYYITHTADHGTNGTISAISCCVIGDYLYVNYYNSSGPATNRWVKAILTSRTDMTTSGTEMTSCVTSVSDGTYMYVYNTPYYLYKYSISGTVKTYIANVHFSSSGYRMGATCDGTNIFLVDDIYSTIRKYALTGGSVLATSAPRSIMPRPNARTPYTGSLIMLSPDILAYTHLYGIDDYTTSIGSEMVINPTLKI